MVASFGREASLAINSQTPGPVDNTVFIPLRKSGMPQLSEREREREREISCDAQR